MAEQEMDPAIADALRGLPADFAGFDRVFQTKLQPELAGMEEGRVLAAAKAKKGYLYGALIALIGAGFEFFFLKGPALVISGGIIGFITAVIMGNDLRVIGQKAKSMMVVPVAGEFGLDFIEKPGRPVSMRAFEMANLLPGYDRDRYEDRLTGERNGVDFEFFEAHLEDKRTTRDGNGRTKTRWVTVFRGQCLRFNFHKAFLGRTLVARDAGFFNRFGGRGGLKIAKLEDPVFEEAFSVYTTDQVESRFLLTPDFMQRLVDLEQTFQGGRLRCAFEGGEIFIAVEGGNLFETGSLFTPLDNPARIRELLDDFAVVFHLIDAVSDPASVKR